MYPTNTGTSSLSGHWLSTVRHLDWTSFCFDDFPNTLCVCCRQLGEAIPAMPNLESLRLSPPTNAYLLEYILPLSYSYKRLTYIDATAPSVSSKTLEAFCHARRDAFVSNRNLRPFYMKIDPEPLDGQLLTPAVAARGNVAIISRTPCMGETCEQSPPSLTCPKTSKLSPYRSQHQYQNRDQRARKSKVQNLARFDQYRQTLVHVVLHCQA